MDAMKSSEESQWCEDSTGLKSEHEEMTTVEIMIQSRILGKGQIQSKRKTDECQVIVIVIIIIIIIEKGFWRSIKSKFL